MDPADERGAGLRVQRFQLGDVSTAAKGLAFPREHDDVHVGVLVQRFEIAAQFFQATGIERVRFLRAIQEDKTDAIWHTIGPDDPRKPRAAQESFDRDAHHRSLQAWTAERLYTRGFFA